MTKAQFDCHSCRLRKLECFSPLGPDQLSFISSFRKGELRIDAGGNVLEQASSAAHFYTLYEGWTVRRVTLPDGRSQITNFGLPGALLGMQAALDQDMDHSVEALTDVLLCVFPRSEFGDLFSKEPTLAYRVVWQASREETFLHSNITAVGRKQADERIAYLLASLYERARRSGLLLEEQELDLPITQQHVADAMGLSIAHTHRVLRRFAGKGLIKASRGQMRVLDADRLAEIGHFDRESVLPIALL